MIKLGFSDVVRTRARRLLSIGAPTLLICAATQTAQANVGATLNAQFIPERLGGETTLNFSFSFSAPAGQVPPPLTQIELRYPNDLGFALSGLGLRTCDAQQLEASGPSGCPANSIMGAGKAFTGIVLGTTIVSELAPIAVIRAPDQEGHLAVFFYSEGTTPVDSKIVFPGLLLPAPAPFALLSVGVPLVPTLPGAPYISLIHLNANIGPRNVTYVEPAGNRTLAYKPKGILLPKTCPPGGFPFEAQFSFLDHSTATAHTTVPCPTRTKRRPRRY